jgi:hypothetical protein
VPLQLAPSFIQGPQSGSTPVSPLDSVRHASTLPAPVVISDGALQQPMIGMTLDTRMAAPSLQQAGPISASATGAVSTPEVILDPMLGSSTTVDIADLAPATPRTHLQARIHKPKVYSDGTIRYTFSTTLSTTSWKAVMNGEYIALMCNKPWHFVPPQAGRNVIDCK